MKRDHRNDPSCSGNVRAACTKRPVLSLCLRCRDGREAEFQENRGGGRLARAIMQAGIEHADIDVRGVHCMSQCKRPCVLALSGPARFTYVFGDLDPALHADDVVALAILYAGSPDGFMKRADRPRPMRAGVLGRVPPLGWDGAAVETITLEKFNSDGEF